MAKGIQKYLDEQGKHIKFDKHLIEQFQKFKMGWLRKGERGAGHMEWYIGHTFGEQQLTFSVVDEQIIVQEILNLDSRELRKEILKFAVVKVGGKVLENYKFHIITWCIIGFQNSKLSDSDKILAIDLMYEIFAFMKVSSAFQIRFGEFLAPHDAAEATFEHLSWKFILKQTGSWQAMFKYLAQDFHPRIRERDMIEKGTHYDRIQKGSDDDYYRIIMAINTKVMGYINNIYGVYRELMATGTVNRKSESIVTDHGEDGSTIKEITDNPQKHVIFLRDIVVIKTDFVKPKLVAVICEIMPNIPYKSLEDTLQHISSVYMKDKDKILEMFNVSVISGINYLQVNEVSSDNINERIEEALELLRGRWVTAKGQSNEVTNFKEHAQQYVREATGKKTRSMVVTTGIGVGLYLFLRAIAGKKV